MKPEYREEMIAALILWTGWNKSAFDKLSDRELTEMYDRHYLRER